VEQMPRDILEFRVVIASPSDVFDARRAAFEAIYELNRSFEAQKISIRAMGWEEYVTPGIGSEAQNVINEQLLRDYDILLAIFGTKLGTPTSTFASGTVEEIEHAISNSGNPLGKYRVQVYFLDKIDSAASISIDELKRVVEFRKQLEPRGVLYRLFKDDNELQQEVRINIQRSILEYLNGRSTPPSTMTTLSPNDHANPSSNLTPNSDPFEGEGLLDIQEEAEEAIHIAGNAMNRINELIVEIGKETDSQVSDIEKYSMASTKDKKRSINEYASFIEDRATRLKREAYIARENFSLYSQAIISLAALQRQGGDAEQYSKDLAALLMSAETILSTLPGNRTSIEGFKTAIRNLPRITSQFNRSKRLLIEALDECIILFDQTERSIYEITGST
jgi:hypothetical protein